MKPTQDLSCEKKGHIGFVLYFVNLSRKPSLYICKKKRVVIKLILYDEYILVSFSRFHVVFVIKKKRQIYIEFKGFWKEKKEELEMQKTRMGYYPFSGLCCDRKCWSSVATVVLGCDYGPWSQQGP